MQVMILMMLTILLLNMLDVGADDDDDDAGAGKNEEQMVEQLESQSNDLASHSMQHLLIHLQSTVTDQTGSLRAPHSMQHTKVL